ncbi:MAG: hypothetical protein NVSMB5_02880 [Candidatus Velthaea sp.]
MIVAPVAAAREGELRALLASMNRAPGAVDPDNALVPFSKLGQVHFARLFTMDDATVDDVELFGLEPRSYPVSLCFMGEIDGDRGTFLRDLTRSCEPGLRKLFDCCEGFDGAADIAAWMRGHEVRSAAAYTNWVGRTMRNVREDAALHAALARWLDAHALAIAERSPRELNETLQAFADDEIKAGRLTLTAEPPTPLFWYLREMAHLIGVPLLLLVTWPLLAIAGAVVLLRIRQLELSDPQFCPRVSLERAEKLARIEDLDVTNQFSAMGSLKPGRARRWASTFILWLTDYAARHVFTRGHLARIKTIHFARWVWLDDKQRLIFCSSYDGSLDSYNDDFINKVGFGLNLTFSGGIGYPRTNWLVFDGAEDEQKFKYYLRRHQMPTQVWYNAHPGLTALDLARNAAIRAGLYSASRSDDDARAWVALL